MFHFYSLLCLCAKFLTFSFSLSGFNLLCKHHPFRILLKISQPFRTARCRLQSRKLALELSRLNLSVTFLRLVEPSSDLFGTLFRDLCGTCYELRNLLDLDLFGTRSELEEPSVNVFETSLSEPFRNLYVTLPWRSSRNDSRHRLATPFS
jgi:hypothetical protein